MTGKKTESVATDPVFLEELSDYLEVLSNPLRLKILKFIEHDSRELAVIAEHITRPVVMSLSMCFFVFW